MHGTGIQGFSLLWPVIFRFTGGIVIDECCGIFRKGGQTMIAAEVVGFFTMNMGYKFVFIISAHAANRISKASGCLMMTVLVQVC
jgi:hypothetical protein